MGAFGGSGEAMPFFDELADRSFVFRDAIAASAWTSPSVAALFTSRHQSQHGVTAFTSMLRPEEVTLAEILSERGYATGGFSANWLIRKKAGYGQGFDYFVAQKGVGPAFRSRSERARRTSRRALGWIDGLPTDPSRPLFVYLHLMDPHTPYNPSAETTTWAFGEQPQISLGQINDAVHERKSRPMGADMKKAVRKAYRAEVRDVDNEMGAFIAGLEERGLLENSLVVVLADHGE